MNVIQKTDLMVHSVKSATEALAIISNSSADSHVKDSVSRVISAVAAIGIVVTQMVQEQERQERNQPKEQDK